ncbi:MAG: DUF1893 domain-containing protein [Verrucomicrobia bacterium]|nr:DUF1893 domain-containing protein [Verrucomicrobiota bacterium]
MTDLALARQLLDAEQRAFVLVNDGRVIATGDDYGVRELLAATDRIGAAARGASLADKVVGKAVALIVVHAGIAAVDTRVASESAVKLLRSRAVPFTATAVVPQILNRRGDGPCPMEKTTTPFDDVGAGLAALREFIAARRAGVPLPPDQPVTTGRARVAG